MVGSSGSVTSHNSSRTFHTDADTCTSKPRLCIPAAVRRGTPGSPPRGGIETAS